jgi:hypothetical protein
VTAKADFVVENYGSLFLLEPRTEAGQLWCPEHLLENRQVFGGAIVVEHRYIRDIVVALQSDGYVVV